MPRSRAACSTSALRRAQRPPRVAPVADVAVHDRDELDVVSLHPPRGARAAGLQLAIIRMSPEANDPELAIVGRRSGTRSDPHVGLDCDPIGPPRSRTKTTTQPGVIPSRKALYLMMRIPRIRWKNGFIAQELDYSPVVRMSRGVISSNLAVKCRSTGGSSTIRRPRRCSRALEHLDRGLDHVIDVALRVDPARDGQADQLHRRTGGLAGSGSTPPNMTLPISTARMPAWR